VDEVKNDADNVGESDAELRDRLLKRRIEIMHFARQPENEVNIALGEQPGKHGARVTETMKLPEWETAITFTFTRERIKGRTFGSTRLVDHLSIGFSLPQHATKGEVTLIRDTILNMLAPLVTEWFGPVEVHAQISPQDPIPVGNPETRQVTWRTPIHAHFVVPVEDDGVVDKRGL